MDNVVPRVVVVCEEVDEVYVEERSTRQNLYLFAMANMPDWAPTNDHPVVYDVELAFAERTPS